MYNYQKSSLAHQVRIIQIFIRIKLLPIGISGFLFFSSIYKIIRIYKITLKTLNLSQVVATAGVLFIAISLHKYMKWSNEYLTTFVLQECNLLSKMLGKILKYLIVIQYIKEKCYEILFPEYYPDVLPWLDN